MTAIKKVAVLGATGALGEVLIPALLQADFEVTCITRTDSKRNLPIDVVVRVSDYSDVAALTVALKDQDAVVEAFNPAAASYQTHILQAALAAGVKHIITPDFSGNTFHPNAKEAVIFNPKLTAQREVERVVAESNGSLAWTAIISGPWYDWTIERGIFWVNKENRTVTRYGSGDQKYSISRRALNGEALVAVLNNPEEYRNRAAYFASHTVSTNQLIAVVKDLGLENWKIVDVPFDGFAEKAHAMWQEDTENGVTDRLNSKAYAALSTVALLDEGNRYGSNFEDQVESGWDEGGDALKENLRRLLE
ncbi:hypothetical protein CORC01_06483 [Colletotrichum orchidophilum]|uniref:NAD(P)-binding domain-containing protein n=1 Tax=Colletotrichum orchidophilum TaxID=1209926 RepID=A0A1G4BAF0_9PEZI|nr:uncharacterized protein CORC01_06483 [Colletotrichum orchidophilum]OHE98286.1 hypothetical protein CORC01_06483 [Colletotrichum orchidophilum]